MDQEKLKQNRLKRDHSLTDPCWEESQQSLKCLTGGTETAPDSECQIYFDNYNNCRKFWRMVMKERKRNDIFPALPLPNEREEARKQYSYIMDKILGKR